MSRVWKLSLLTAFLLILDQLAKGTIQSTLNINEKIDIINGFLRFTHDQNPTLALGFLNSAPEWLKSFLTKVFPLFVGFWMVYLVWILRYTEEKLCSLGYTLVLIGVFGNLLDRWSISYIVDFIEFYFGNRVFPAFNISDACLFIAGNIFIVDFIVFYVNEKTNRSE